MGLPYQQAPIGRLNADILRIVFWTIAENIRHYYGNKDGQMNWVRLGHVCAFWRAVLMDMPALWAKHVLAFGVQRAFDDILARAQDAPLNLQYNNNIPQETVAQTIHLFSRAKLLSVRRPERVVLDAISCPLPLLQTLKIYASSASNIVQNTGYASSLIGLQALRELEMSHIYLCPPLCGRLVSLSIIQPPHLSSPSLDEILDVFARNTALENLVLDHAFDEQTTMTARPRLVMSALTSFHLSFEAIGLVHDLLGALNMPVLQELDFNIAQYSDIPSEDIFSTLASALSAYRAAFFIPSYPKLVLQADIGPDTLSFGLAVCRKESCYEQRFDITLTLDEPFEFQDIASVAGCFLDAHIAKHVQKLSWDASHAGYSNPEYWNMVFSTFNNMEEFILSLFDPQEGEGIEDVLAALTCHLPEAEGKLPLPYLRRMVAKIELVSDEMFRLHNMFKETIRQRVEMGGVAYDAWLSIYSGSRGPDTTRWLKECAEEADVDLSGLRCSDGQVEWRVKLEDE